MNTGENRKEGQIMKVKPTMQTITINGNTVTIGNHSFTYDKVKKQTHKSGVYFECFINGNLEDRFLIA